MIIHVVQRGETTKSIAEGYGVSEERLILENEIKYPKRLALGETLVILYPKVVYRVQEGDTLLGIAEKNGISILELLRNNPYLSNRDNIYQGENLVIKYVDEKIMNIATNGYVYPFVDVNILKKTLPFLTYLTIYSHKINSHGEINDIDDKELIGLARRYGVAPIMILTASADSQKDEIDVMHKLLHDKAKQDALIRRLIIILKDKCYYGVNINTPYILPEDRNLYVDFITKFSNRLSAEGLYVINTLSLSAFEIMTGIMYDGLEYKKIGQAVDATMFISYEWGYSLGVPSGIVPYETVGRLINNMTALIPPQKMLIGMPCIGHVWKLPYEPGLTRGLTISYESAIEIAYENNQVIKFDPTTKLAFYQYISVEEYMVRFRDARSIDAFTKLIPAFGLRGNGIWNIMIYYPQMWLVINSQYQIDKVL